ncbi:xanthine dehydrogenase family protein subunit M [Mesorhizobium sp. ZMM04-5]|uniref:Xanthine dehydrogenase family protein subunit M n=1 Tax=Mesorhizobium marinum TaxID=3228790 RepID=A0ABV3R2P8_9HYPH
MPLALKTYPTLGEAGSALKETGARYLGGGTLVVRSANEGDVSFSTFVRSTDPALSVIDVKAGRATVGASVTMSAVAAHPDLSAIAMAAKAVGGPAVRNMATVGGNLFAAAPYGDFAVALLALDATVHTTAGDLGIEEFLARRDGRIVAGVSFAVPLAGSFRFLKVSRVRPKGTSVLSIAAVFDVDAGVVGDARIALGCMADRPIRARAAEMALAGATLGEEDVAPAVAAIGEGTEPITDAVASAWYRAEVLPVHFRRLLLE